MQTKRVTDRERENEWMDIFCYVHSCRMFRTNTKHRWNYLCYNFLLLLLLEYRVICRWCIWLAFVSMTLTPGMDHCNAMFQRSCLPPAFSTQFDAFACWLRNLCAWSLFMIYVHDLMEKCTMYTQSEMLIGWCSFAISFWMKKDTMKWNIFDLATIKN